MANRKVPLYIPSRRAHVGAVRPESQTPAQPSALVVEQLTRRENTILELLASHLSLPEIGLELHISRHTVKSHVRRIYRKLGATSRSGAVTAARELGILAR